MALRRAGSGLSALIFLLVAVGLSYGVWRGVLRGDTPALAADLLTYRVQPIELEITASETGTLMSASSVPVYSEVDGRVAIVSLVPEGTRVAAGDVVVELESAQFNTQRTEQQIAVEKARSALSQAQQNDIVARSQTVSDVQKAELGVEFAELDLKKYLEGDYPLELRGLQTETKLAEEELERAKSPLPVLEELRRDGYFNDSQFEAERFRAVRAEARVQMAKEKELLLRKYSFPRQKRDLESKVTEAKRALERVKSLALASVEQAKTKLKAEESALSLEEQKLARLEDQIAKCTLRAPQAGVVVYPAPEDNDMVELIIKEGTEIRRRQHVFSIPDTDVLEVAAAFNEAIINQIKPGMGARVSIGVLPDLQLSGQVKFVSSLPDPQDWRKTTVKFYQTKIALTEQFEGLRPGMTAKTEILIDHLPGVLAVPVQSVVQRGKNGVCYVLAGGTPVLRKLVLGKSSVEYIVVQEGLSAGELVVLAPDQLGIPADAFTETKAPLVAPDLPTTQSPGTTPGAPSEAAGLPAELPPEVPIEETELGAVLLGTGAAIAEAEYEIQTQGGKELKREFEIEVKNGEPGATLEVSVAGVVIGSVTLDAAGYVLHEWSTKDGSLPPEFPLDAGEGAKVTVGPELEGALAP